MRKKPRPKRDATSSKKKRGNDIERENITLKRVKSARKATNAGVKASKTTAKSTSSRICKHLPDLSNV